MPSKRGAGFTVSKGNNPRVLIEVDVPEPWHYPSARFKKVKRSFNKTQWLYGEKDVRIKRVHFVGDPAFADAGNVPLRASSRELGYQ